MSFYDSHQIHLITFRMCDIGGHTHVNTGARLPLVVRMYIE
jgi:hypothetical protein